MKTPLSCLLLCMGLYATGCKQAHQQATANDSLINSPDAVAAPEVREGARLIAANDCITCHAVKERLVGPSFSEIAARYHNDLKYATYLSNSVVHGSKGVWGEQEMTPHLQLHVRDIEAMVRYILSVDTTQRR